MPSLADIMDKTRRDAAATLARKNYLSQQADPSVGSTQQVSLFFWSLSNFVKQAILFDGLYSQVDKFTNWIQADATHRFVNLYTNTWGGTDEVSQKMMQLLREKKNKIIKPQKICRAKIFIKLKTSLIMLSPVFKMRFQMRFIPEQKRAAL